MSLRVALTSSSAHACVWRDNHAHFLHGSSLSNPIHTSFAFCSSRASKKIVQCAGTKHLLPFSKLPRHQSKLSRSKLSQQVISRTPLRAGVATVENADADAKSDELESSSSTWLDFAGATSGEWDGYGADFDSQGQAQTLPESVVPQTFKDWDLKILAWQMQGPTLAKPDGSLYSKTIRLIPTVGCEADAATPHSVEEKRAGSSSHSVAPAAENDIVSEVQGRASFLAWHPEGSYVAVWPGKTVEKSGGATSTASVVLRKQGINGLSQWELEHCLVGEVSVGKKGGKARARVRILQQMENDNKDGVLMLKGVTVYRERWEGDFRNGESLGGCSSPESGFAEAEKTARAALGGWWTAHSFSALPGDVSPEEASTGSSELQSEGVSESDLEPSDDGLMLLPLGVWSDIRKLPDASGWVLSAGWLRDADKALVSSCQCTPGGSLQMFKLAKLDRGMA